MVSCFMATATGLYFNIQDFLPLIFMSSLTADEPVNLSTSFSLCLPPLVLTCPLPGPALLHPELPGEAADMRQEMSAERVLTCLKAAITW